MRLLIFSDLHLHNWNYGSTIESGGFNSRLLDQYHALLQISKYIVKNPGISHAIFCGDLFHSHGRLTADILYLARLGLKEICSKVGVTFLIGNHDIMNKSNKINSLCWIDEIRHAKIVTNQTHYEETGLSFCSYTENKDGLKKFLEQSGPYTFLHQGVQNVPMGSGFLINEILSEEIVPTHINRLFTGHYHTHRNINRITIVGSMNQLNWSDTGDTKGFLDYDTDSNIVRQIPIFAPRFINMDLCGVSSLGGIATDSVKSIKNNFIRVKNFNKDYIDDLKQEFSEAGARSVEFILPTDRSFKRLETISEFHLPTLVKEYVATNEIEEERYKIGLELMK